MPFGMERPVLESLFWQKIGPLQGLGLSEADLDRIARAVAAVVDENNVAITRALEAAGIRIKGDD